MRVPSITAAIVNYRTPAPSVQPPPVFSAASRLRSASSDRERIALAVCRTYGTRFAAIDSAA
jgi:hypothetical protein